MQRATTTAGTRPRIGIFGRRNVGKSSLMNCLTGQQAAIVSQEAGTTTDPVRKAMELTGIGPVVLIDTAGLDDDSGLGAQRVERSREILREVELALLLYVGADYGDEERGVVQWCDEHGTPLILIHSHADVEPQGVAGGIALAQGDEQSVRQIEEAIVTTLLRGRRTSNLLQGCVEQGDVVVMVTPIDSSAPEGRMILPQVRTLRAAMDMHARVVVCQPQELRTTMTMLREEPRLVVTDSQAFAEVANTIDAGVRLTSFSMLLARSNAAYGLLCEGTRSIAQLQDGDEVLLLEACTHNVTCEDIGRVKLPAALRRKTGRELKIEVRNTADAIDFASRRWRLVVICGGCMTTPQRVANIAREAAREGIAVSNYGMALAWCGGIFERCMAAQPPLDDQQ